MKQFYKVLSYIYLLNYLIKIRNALSKLRLLGDDHFVIDFYSKSRSEEPIMLRPPFETTFVSNTHSEPLPRGFSSHTYSRRVGKR